MNPGIESARAKLLANVPDLALSSVHGVAFHRGLGNPLRPTSGNPTKKYLNAGNLLAYSMVAYAKPNIAVVANGAPFDDLKKWVGEFFSECPEKPLDGVPLVGDEPTQYYGGEERVARQAGSAMVIAFPGSSSFTGKAYKPELAVLAALLGGGSNIKWSPGFSLLSRATEAYPQAHVQTVHRTYSDAGLITVSLHGDGAQIANASKDVVKALKDTASGKISSEEIKKAKATAKFQALESGQNIDTGLESTGAGLIHGGKPYQLDELGKSLDSVTEDQVKAVSARPCLPKLCMLIFTIGCPSAVGRQSIRLDYWRSLFATIRGRDWVECVKCDSERILYQHRIVSASIGIHLACPLVVRKVGAPILTQLRLRNMKQMPRFSPTASSLQSPQAPQFQPLRRLSHQPHICRTTFKMTFAWKQAGLTYAAKLSSFGKH